MKNLTGDKELLSVILCSFLLLFSFACSSSEDSAWQSFQIFMDDAADGRENWSSSGHSYANKTLTVNDLNIELPVDLSIFNDSASGKLMTTLKFKSVSITDILKPNAMKKVISLDSWVNMPLTKMATKFVSDGFSYVIDSDDVTKNSLLIKDIIIHNVTFKEAPKNNTHKGILSFLQALTIDSAEYKDFIFTVDTNFDRNNPDDINNSVFSIDSFTVKDVTFIEPLSPGSIFANTGEPSFSDLLLKGLKMTLSTSDVDAIITLDELHNAGGISLYKFDLYEMKKLLITYKDTFNIKDFDFKIDSISAKGLDFSDILRDQYDYNLTSAANKLKKISSDALNDDEDTELYDDPIPLPLSLNNFSFFFSYPYSLDSVSIDGLSLDAKIPNESFSIGLSNASFVGPVKKGQFANQTSSLSDFSVTFDPNNTKNDDFTLFLKNYFNTNTLVANLMYETSYDPVNKHFIFDVSKIEFPSIASLSFQMVIDGITQEDLDKLATISTEDSLGLLGFLSSSDIGFSGLNLKYADTALINPLVNGLATEIDISPEMLKMQVLSNLYSELKYNLSDFLGDEKIDEIHEALTTFLYNPKDLLIVAEPPMSLNAVNIISNAQTKDDIMKLINLSFKVNDEDPIFLNTLKK
jgi:hypothetical protein